MHSDKAICKNYRHGDLLNAIQIALAQSGKSVDKITIEDLAPVDEFHIGGRQATEHLFNQLTITEKDHVLDVGCGLGGASRYVAHRYNNRVTGIDLTEEYITTGNALCAWVHLDKQINLHQGSALSMPFHDETFDAAYMMHVGMNIEDKVQLFKEVYRVLRTGASFAIYDVMQINNGELTYPVPWSTEKGTSHLASPKHYKQALEKAGFEVSKENNRHEFALDFFKHLRAKTKANGESPPLGLNTLLQESAAIRVKNIIHGLKEGYIAPVEMIVNKR